VASTVPLRRLTLVLLPLRSTSVLREQPVR